MAGTALKWMPTTVIEALSRLPPGRKMGQIHILYPRDPFPDLPHSKALDDDEMTEKMAALMERTRKSAVRKQYMYAYFYRFYQTTLGPLTLIG